jgi:hypothetical protein
MPGWFPRQGGPANHRRTAALRGRIAARLQDKHADFRSTPAAENLSDTEGITVSAATPRRVQIRLGQWKPRTRRGQCASGQSQGPGPLRTLTVFDCDATGRLTPARTIYGLFRVDARDGKTEPDRVAERREIGARIVCASRRNSIFDQLTADPESTYRLPPGVRFFKGFSRGYF